MTNNNNEFYLSFCQFVEEQSKELELEEKHIANFLLKVPEKYLGFVKKGIVICGSLEKFKKTVPLFEELFTRQDKANADNVIVSDKKQNRLLRKKTKQALLWAGQLLRATGGKNKTSVAPYVIINEYLSDLEQQELFCLKTKLMAVNGKLVRMCTPTQRKIQRNAKAFRQVKLFEEIAIKKGWQFGFLTLTLPPIFHPNPTVSKVNSYCGATPQQAVDTINKFWVLIRSELSHYGFIAGEDFNGIRVYEGHKDSCLHSHIMLFIHPRNMKLLESIIKGVESRQRIAIAKQYNIPVKDMKLKWDFKPEWDNKSSKKKAKASSYLFKYISPDMNDKDTLANDALCSAYGVRRLQFFGLKNKISTFEFICKYWQAYEPYIENKEVVEMLRNKDLALFHFKYQQDFENVNVVKKSKIVNGKLLNDYRMMGVSYIPNRNSAYKQKEILITKEQYVLVENEDKQVIKQYGKEMIGLKFCDDRNLYDNNIANALKAYPKAQEKQNEFNNGLLAYFKKQSFQGIDNFIPVCNCYYSETNDEVIKQYWAEELEEQMKQFELNFVEDYFYEFNGLMKPSELELDISSELLIGTLKQHYSSKNPSGFYKEPDKPDIELNFDELEAVFN